MAISKFLDPKNDFAFKRIFGSEKNQDILIHFINDMLGFAGKEGIQTVSKKACQAKADEYAHEQEEAVNVFEKNDHFFGEFNIAKPRCNSLVHLQ